MRCAATALCLIGLATGCVSPARSFDVYESKAAETASAALEAVGTAQLTLGLAMKRRAFSPYEAILSREAENDATSVQGTFDSIQPPDERSDGLQKELDKILDDATSTLMDLRIAARRNQLAREASKARELADAYRSLNDFVEAHS